MTFYYALTDIRFHLCKKERVVDQNNSKVSWPFWKIYLMTTSKVGIQLTADSINSRWFMQSTADWITNKWVRNYQRVVFRESQFTSGAFLSWKLIFRESACRWCLARGGFRLPGEQQKSLLGTGKSFRWFEIRWGVQIGFRGTSPPVFHFK